MPHIQWQRTVIRDGWHNMGTSLCFWRDCYWLVYSRHASHASHASHEGTTIVNALTRPKALAHRDDDRFGNR